MLTYLCLVKEIHCAVDEVLLLVGGKVLLITKQTFPLFNSYLISSENKSYMFLILLECPLLSKQDFKARNNLYLQILRLLAPRAPIIARRSIYL